MLTLQICEHGGNGVCTSTASNYEVPPNNCKAHWETQFLGKQDYVNSSVHAHTGKCEIHSDLWSLQHS